MTLRHREPKRPSDPRELRAIVDLEAAGWTLAEVVGLLGISVRTYRRRKAEIRRWAGAARRGAATCRCGPATDAGGEI